MATIEWNESKHKYQFKIVDRDYTTKKALYDLIRTNELFNPMILNFLREHGVDVSFLKEDIENRQQGGRYSTIGAHKVANELTSLITLYVGDVRKVKKDNGEEVWEPVNISLQKLAEEAGHFIVGALGNNRLVQRLIDRIRKPEVRRALLGSEYESAVLGTDELREAAGRLVGDALIGYLKELRAYGNWYYTEIWDLHILLSRRIADFAIKITARRIARKIVELPSSSFNLDTALKTQETFSTQASANMKTYRCMVSTLTAALEKLRAASKKASDDHLEELARITEELVRIARNGIADQRTDKISVNAGTIFGRMTVLERIAEPC